jgi:hypothetical protein
VGVVINWAQAQLTFLDWIFQKCPWLFFLPFLFLSPCPFWSFSPTFSDFFSSSLFLLTRGQLSYLISSLFFCYAFLSFFFFISSSWPYSLFSSSSFLLSLSLFLFLPSRERRRLSSWRQQGVQQGVQQRQSTA